MRDAGLSSTVCSRITQINRGISIYPNLWWPSRCRDLREHRVMLIVSIIDDLFRMFVAASRSAFHCSNTAATIIFHIQIVIAFTRTLRSYSKERILDRCLQTVVVHGNVCDDKGKWKLTSAKGTHHNNSSLLVLRQKEGGKHVLENFSGLNATFHFSI